MNNPLGLVLRLLCIILIKVMRFVVNTFFFILPVGIYVWIMQFSNKMSALSSLGAYTEEKSEWMFIYPNTILISIKPNEYKTSIKRWEKEINSFVEKHKNILLILFFVTIITIILCK